MQQVFLLVGYSAIWLLLADKARTPGESGWLLFCAVRDISVRAYLNERFMLVVHSGLLVSVCRFTGRFTG